eukprot:3686669-Lingulodinium_polyedra.AAC.1
MALGCQRLSGAPSAQQRGLAYLALLVDLAVTDPYASVVSVQFYQFCSRVGWPSSLPPRPGTLN